ncbi:MAG: aminotransferase [Acidimicrobiia bacterium]
MVKRTIDQIDPPVGVVDLLREGLPVDEVLDAAQGAPAYPTAPSIVERVREVAGHPDGGRYTDGRGLPALRAALAKDLSQDYGAAVSPEDVLITAGSNQAFCLAASALAEPGDEVILTDPFYFNHDMWVRMDGLSPVYATTSAGTGQVVVDDVDKRVTGRTRMIVLTSPGNPTGVTASPEVIDELANLARAKDLVLVLDETYRTFRPGPGPAHRLFHRHDWHEYFVSLQSFSKDFAMPGYRVGALVGSPLLLDEVMKLMDCVAICAPRIGQEAALEGLRSAGVWRKQKAAEIAAKHDRFRSVMSGSPGGFRLRQSGGFYGWVEHPGPPSDTDAVVRRLATEQGLLTIAGSVFTPEDRGFVRVSFANLELHQIDELARRLAVFQVGNGFLLDT